MGHRDGCNRAEMDLFREAVEALERLDAREVLRAKVGVEPEGPGRLPAVPVREAGPEEGAGPDGGGDLPSGWGTFSPSEARRSTTFERLVGPVTPVKGHAGPRVGRRPSRRALDRVVAGTCPAAGPGPGSAPRMVRPDPVEVRAIFDGRRSPEAVLDLHGQTEQDALEGLRLFLGASREHGRRLVLVVTGRGRHSAGGVAVLRPALREWLETRAGRQVLWVHEAPPHLGGEGALLVKLRKLRA